MQPKTCLTRQLARSGRSLLPCIVVLLCLNENQAAAPPVIEFNTDYVVRCRDVTPAGCKNREKKLVEATFRISALLVNGKEADLEQCLYTIYDGKKAKTLVVMDYLPKTELKSEITDPLIIIESTTSETSRSGALTAGYKAVAAADFRANRKDRVASTAEYKKLPPVKLLLASGITERGNGIFCKLKPSEQITIEGDRVFSCIFAVPKNWRGDYLYVKCQGTGYKRGISSYFDEKVEAGLARFALGLYLDGDAETEQLAQRLAGVQQEFLDEVTKRENEASNDWFAKIESGIHLRPRWSPTGKACLFNCKLMENVEANKHAIDLLPASLRVKYEEADALQKRLESCAGK